MKNLILSLLLLASLPASAATFANSFTTNAESPARAVVTNIASAVTTAALLATPTIGSPVISAGPINATATIFMTGGPWVFGNLDMKIDSLTEGLLVLDANQNPNMAVIGAGLTYTPGTRTLAASVTGSTGIATNGGSGTNNPLTGARLFTPTNENAFFTNTVGTPTNTLARFYGRDGNNFLIDSNARVNLPAGTALRPALSWAGDETTGFYRSSGNINFSYGGVIKGSFHTSGLNFFGAGVKVGFNAAGGGSAPYFIGNNDATGVGLKVDDVFGQNAPLQVGELNVTDAAAGSGILRTPTAQIASTNFANFFRSTNGFGSFSTNFVPVTANTDGATNATIRTEIWNIVGTSGSLVFYNRTGLGGSTAAANALWTNTVSTLGADYIVGPNCGIQIVTGVGTVLSRRSL